MHRFPPFCLLIFLKKIFFCLVLKDVTKLQVVLKDIKGVTIFGDQENYVIFFYCDVIIMGKFLSVCCGGNRMIFYDNNCLRIFTYCG